MSRCKNGHERTTENTYVDPTTGYRSCRVCKHTNKHTPKAKLKRRGYALKALYGVDISFVDGKPCEICGTTDFGGHFPCVDHDHKTEQIRGVLCQNCNTGLGKFKDSETRLLLAVLYLRKYRGTS